MNIGACGVHACTGKRWGGREHVGKAVTNRWALRIKKLSCTKAEAPLLVANQTLNTSYEPLKVVWVGVWITLQRNTPRTRSA